MITGDLDLEIRPEPSVGSLRVPSSQVRSVAPRARSHGLLMVRQALFSFEGPAHLVSTTFQHLLKERDSLAEQIAAAQFRLSATLHALVPTLENPVDRRMALATRRAINRADVLPIGALKQLATHAETSVLEDLSQYESLLSRYNQLFDDHRSQIFADIRKGLHDLITVERFASAVSYSSPSLLSTYRSSTPPTDDFSKEERGLYAYATKAISKANPFHLFAAVACAGEPFDATNAELIVDTSLILELEELALRTRGQIDNEYLSLTTWDMTNGKYRFFLSDRRVSCFSVPVSHALTTLIQSCTDCGGPVRRSDLVKDLLQSDLNISIEQACSFIDKLTQADILRPYLIESFSNFSEVLLPSFPQHADSLLTLQRIHRRRSPIEEVPFLLQQAEILTLPGSVERLKGSAYKNRVYINTSETASLSPHQDLATPSLLADLTALKPLFVGRTPNPACLEIIERLASQTSDERVPLLDVITQLLRLNVPVLNAAITEHERARYRQLSHLTGSLTQETMEQLTPRPISASSHHRSLCFNGTPDLSQQLFYLSNIFPGDDRYASRYSRTAPHRSPQSPIPESASALDVQIYMHLPANRGLVEPIYDTGCSFQARFQNLFQKWIQPGQVLVSLEDNGITFHDSVSGQLLRFHSCSYILAEYLPVWYQLLLVNDNDYFINPFDACVPEAGTDVTHQKALWFGDICLRRTRWYVPASTLHALNHRDLLLYTAALRSLLRMDTGSQSEQWYFFAATPGGLPAKPRFLEVDNPLSAKVFRRETQRVPGHEYVAFSSMEPTPQSLYQHRGQHWFTEAMIQV